MSGRKPPNPRSRAQSPSTSSSSPPRPPPSRRTPSGAQAAVSSKKKRRSPNQGYTLPREKSGGGGHRRSEYQLILCVFHSSSHGWRTRTITIDRNRTTDRELWTDIRRVYRDELQMVWRRLLLFKKLKHIVPIEYTRNDVPKRTDPKDYPDSNEFMHRYHHPQNTRSEHRWVDWFISLEKDPDKTYGLEFVEGLWADKLALLAILSTIAIVVVSVVWCLKGGNLQTVFTVMSFVLGGVTAELALLALYYQVTLSG